MGLVLATYQSRFRHQMTVLFDSILKMKYGQVHFVSIVSSADRLIGELIGYSGLVVR